MQYNVDSVDFFAGGPNLMSCGSTNLCWWHGTESAGVATGIANNRRGEMGTGGQVADPLLFRINGAADERNRAIRAAVAWGADIVSMSFGVNCNQACRIDDRDDNPYNDAVDSGSKVVFLAAAGNGSGTPGVGYDVGEPSFFHPCIEDHVICVGALQPKVHLKNNYNQVVASIS